MATLAISVVGAVAGNAIGIGASAGWLIGSFVGNALFARGPKTEGPRLGDLSFQASAEGSPVPLLFGDPRVAGTVIWATKIKETRTKKKVGGKGLSGGGSHVSYTYSISLAISLGEGPILGIRKLWADSKLIYSAATNADAGTLYASRKKFRTLRVYQGTETQEPDPVLQAHEGAGNVPGFRGLAYFVLEDLQLADFANHPPNIEAEVVVAGSGIAPWKVNTWSPIIDSPRNARNVDGIIEYTFTTDTGGSTDRLTVQTRTLEGTVLSQRVVDFENVADASNIEHNKVVGYPRLYSSQRQAAGTGPLTSAWVLDGKIVTQPVDPTPYGTDHYRAGFITPVALGGYVFVLMEGPTNEVGIARRQLTNGRPALRLDRFWDAAAAYGVPDSNWGGLSPGDDGLLYLRINVPPRLIALDLELNVVAEYTWPASNPADAAVRSPVIVYDGLMMDVHASPLFKMRLFQLTEPELTFITQIGYPYATDTLMSLGNGLVLARDGVYSMLPNLSSTSTTVGSVVAALCERAGLGVGERDTSALTESVKAFQVARPMAARAAIEPLRQGFFFDGAESPPLLKFVPRGGAVVATLTDDDLGAGIDRPAESRLFITRQQELELPVEVTVGYRNQDNDQQPGMEPARRLTTQSRHVVGVELPIAMTTAKAAQIADTLLQNAWVERETYRWTTTLKWAHLEPADLVALPGGRVARITAIEYMPGGILQFEAYADISTIYSSAAVGEDSATNEPQVVAIEGPTRLELMDIPPLLGAWDPVDQFDYRNSVTVSFSTPAAAVASTTDDAVLRGANAILIGNEIVQFATAVLNGDGAYTLSRLLRGRKGTEEFVGTHVLGERVVVLDSAALEFIELPAGDIGLERLYRAESFGFLQDVLEDQVFTATGRTVRPLAPTHLGATRAPPSGDWTFTWVRRTRIGAAWIDYVDASLDEASESYEVDILDGATVVRTIATASPSAVYTEAQQLADFGGGAANFTWRVYQLGALVGRGRAAEAVAELPRLGRYPRLIMAAKPVLFIQNWTSTTVVDDVGPNNLDGTFSGTKTVNQTDSPLVNESSSRSCSFAGGYAQIADDPLLDLLQDFTVEVWVKYSHADTTRGIVGKWHQTDTAQQAWKIQCGNVVGEIEFLWRTAAGQTQLQHSGGYNDGAWHHIVGVRERGNGWLYIDGVLRASTTSGRTEDLNVTAGAVFIAATDAVQTFTGLVNSVALHNLALAAADVVARYNAGRLT